jgi:hypothetical protein
MKRHLTQAIHRFRGTAHAAKKSDVEKIDEQVAQTKILAAKHLIWELPSRGILPRLQDAEFRVFSQFQDDGIIQYLIHHLQIEPRTFIEFGVENYTESNTRFLLINNQWRGLVIDGSPQNIDYIQSDSIYWKHNLTAVASFITAENINDLFRNNGFTSEVGILSIDIDGNDWHVWKAINSVNPLVVIVEYNAMFGSDHTVTVPYDKNFVRQNAHYSNLYWGASLNAFCHLANEKGYAFVGTSSAGQNAYFVRRDKLGPLKELTSREGYTDASFRDSRGEAGDLTFLSGRWRLMETQDMPVLDVQTGKTVPIRELMWEG